MSIMKRLYVLFSLLVFMLFSVLYFGLVFDRVYTGYVNGDIRVLIKTQMVTVDENAYWYRNDARGRVPLIVDDKLLESTVYVYDVSGEECDLYIILGEGLGHGECVDVSYLRFDDDDLEYLSHQKIYSKREYITKELLEYNELPSTMLTHYEKCLISVKRIMPYVILVNALGLLLSFLQIKPKSKNVLLFLLMATNVFCCVLLILKLFSL